VRLRMRVRLLLLLLLRCANGATEECDAMRLWAARVQDKTVGIWQTLSKLYRGCARAATRDRGSLWGCHPVQLDLTSSTLRC
jgi:hypothetical protein